METITKTFEVYPFCELSEEAQKKAICHHIEFWLDTMYYENGSPNFKKACNKAEAMQTPWFTGNYILDYCEDEIIEEFESLDYRFTKDGEFFND